MNALMRCAYLLSGNRAGKKVLELASRSVILQRVALGGPNPARPWEESGTEFHQLLQQVRGLSLNRPQSLFNIYQLAAATREVPGDVAEVGVYQGGTARVIAHQLAPAGKQIFLFDTFTGLPGTVAPGLDHWKPGDFADTSPAGVARVMSGFPQVEIVAGYFPDTAAGLENRAFSFVHIDVDIARSVADCCEFFYPRLSPGAVMVFDDYGFRSCPGARKVVDGFFAGRPEQPIYFPTGQCVVFRSSDRQRV